MDDKKTKLSNQPVITIVTKMGKVLLIKINHDLHAFSVPHILGSSGHFQAWPG